MTEDQIWFHSLLAPVHSQMCATEYIMAFTYQVLVLKLYVCETVQTQEIWIWKEDVKQILECKRKYPFHCIVS